MGTRGALGFYKDGEHKVTYNHYDSYPGGLGNDVLALCKKTTPEELEVMFLSIVMIKEGEKPTAEQIKKCHDSGSVDLGVSTQSKEDFYCLLRNAQGDLAKYAEIGFMTDGQTFLHDSLFCEYAYIINLDTKKIEVYTGFMKEKPSGRYADIKPSERGGYYAVTLKLEIPLSECSEWTAERIDEEISDPEEEEA